MKITIVQPDIVWENKTENFRLLEQLISPVEGNTDLVILPEMFNTGFSVDQPRLSEPPFSNTHKWMQERAETGNFGICGSYIINEDDRLYNRWVFIAPDRKCITYDKRHLFRMGNEEKWFTRGSERIVFEFRGTRILPNICYDLRFPVWSRNLEDYDLLINSANWPKARNEVWVTLLKARAIENICYVAGSNRIGRDGSGIEYCGNSMIIGPSGKIIAQAETNKESIVSAEISMEELSEFRKKFPANEDADQFTLKI